LADTILLKGISHGSLPTLLAREPAVAFDPMTGNAQLFIGTPGGNQVLTGIPGPAGAAAIPFISVQAALYGAVGDGAHDDTAALQSALNAAIASADQGVFATHQRLGLALPPGIYKITSPLVIDRPGSVYAGWTIQGAGISPQAGALEGGTSIVMAGAAQDAVIQIKRGMFVSVTIRDLSLFLAADTKYGLHDMSTNSSRYLIENVTFESNIAGTVYRTGYCAEYSLGANANGEQPMMINVQSNSLDCGFDFKSGQAYGAILIGCGGLINNGGTAIKVGVGPGTNVSGGYQMTVLGWSGSFLNTGSLPNTFLQVGDVTDKISIKSCRMEACDTIVKTAGVTNADTATITIEDSHFDGMKHNAAPNISGAGNAQYRLYYLRDQFTPGVGTTTYTDTAPTDFKRTTYDGCAWDNWSGGVHLAARPDATVFPTNGFGGTVVRDCWSNMPASPTATSWMAAVTN